MIVGFAAGGATDVQARVLADKLTKRWGQSVVVENKPGATGSIAMANLKQSKADGYTLGVVSGGAMTISPIFRNVGYDPITDFEPMTVIAENDVAVVAAPNSNLKDFAALLSPKQDTSSKLFYGSSGAGGLGHLAGEKFNKVFGTHLSHVPYRGDSALVVDVMSGNLNVGFPVIPSIVELVKSGRLKMLATLGKERAVDFPDIPSASEFTDQEIVITSWIGVFAPKGTPKEIIDTFYQAAKEEMTTPDVVNEFKKQGSRVVASSPDEFRGFLKADFDRNKKLVKDLKITLK